MMLLIGFSPSRYMSPEGTDERDVVCEGVTREEVYDAASRNIYMLPEVLSAEGYQ